MSTFRLKDFVDPIAITVQDPANSGYERFVGLEHYDSNELVVKRFSGVELLTTNAKAFQKNDLLIARRNVYLRRAGVVYFDGITSGDSIVLRVKEDCEKQTGINRELAQRILPLVLNTDKFWIYANKHADGMNSKRISKDTLLDYEFSLPSIEEQKVLADKLWAAYRVKEAYRQLLSTTDEMLKAKFQEMFGDPFTNSKKWKEYGPFSKYTEIILGTTPKSSEPSFWDGNVLWITPAEMNDEVVLYEDTIRHITLEGAKSAHLSILPKGTVLFSTRAPIGKVGIVGKEMYCNQGFKNFHCGELLNEYYLYYSLLQNREYLQSLGTGSTFKELSKSTIEKLCIAVPPIEQQLDFECVFNQAEATKASLRASIEAIDRVIRSLINQ